MKYIIHDNNGMQKKITKLLDILGFKQTLGESLKEYEVYYNTINISIVLVRGKPYKYFPIHLDQEHQFELNTPYGFEELFCGIQAIINQHGYCEGAVKDKTDFLESPVRMSLTEAQKENLCQYMSEVLGIRLKYWGDYLNACTVNNNVPA